MAEKKKYKKMSKGDQTDPNSKELSPESKCKSMTSQMNYWKTRHTLLEKYGHVTPEPSDNVEYIERGGFTIGVKPNMDQVMNRARTSREAKLRDGRMGKGLVISAPTGMPKKSKGIAVSTPPGAIVGPLTKIPKDVLDNIDLMGTVLPYKTHPNGIDEETQCKGCIHLKYANLKENTPNSIMRTSRMCGFFAYGTVEVCKLTKCPLEGGLVAD